MSNTDNCDVKLGKHLKELLKSTDTTVAQLSRRSQVPAKTLYKWLEGQSPRNIEQVKKVAMALNLTVDELCFGAENQPKNKIALKDFEEEIFAGNFDVILRKAKR